MKYTLKYYLPVCALAALLTLLPEQLMPRTDAFTHTVNNMDLHPQSTIAPFETTAEPDTQSVSMESAYTNFAIAQVNNYVNIRSIPSTEGDIVGKLPGGSVAEIQATKDYPKLKDLIYKVFFSCISLGLICCLGFLLLGAFVGNILFHSELAGDYLQTLAWICPFLYLNSTLSSITNGLGKANISFIINSIGLAIRIIGVLAFIPRIGMNGYLWGMLVSQFVTFLLSIFHLGIYLKKRVCC